MMAELSQPSPTPSEGHAVAAEVRAIDLFKLAALVGCTVEELGAQLSLGQEHATQSAQISHPSNDVTFSAAPLFSLTEEPGIETAVLSLAARPGLLDSAKVPKCLIKMGPQTLLGHVLTQLRSGGIRRVVLVLGQHGGAIRKSVKALPVAAHLEIVFVDVGADYEEGFARSLLAAAPRVGNDPFLLCASDHIFDAALVSEMRSSFREGWSEDMAATVLVERHDATDLAKLPNTAVFVDFEDTSKRVMSIGKSVHVSACHGLEAGLYACTGAVFSSLASLLCKTQYFTLAQAMQQLASEGKLGVVLTEDRAWFALETRAQLEETIEGTLHGALFPWQVSIVRASEVTGSRVDDAQKQLVLPLSYSTSYVTTPHEDLGNQQSYSLVALNSIREEEPVEAEASDVIKLKLLDATVFLSDDFVNPQGELSKSGEERLGDNCAATVAPLGSEAKAIKIDLQEQGEVAQTAYLIDVSEMASGEDGSFHDGFILALPKADAPPTSLLGLPASLLPSGITSVRTKVELPEGKSPASALSGHSAPQPTVQLIVNKRVPLVGWFILVTALFCSQSSGAAIDFQRAAVPGETHVFLRCSWRGCATSILMALVSIAFSDSRYGLSHIVFLPPKDKLLLLASGVAFFFNFALFNFSLGHTSLSHAAIYESASSIWMVVGKLALLAVGLVPFVPKPHIIGVLIGFAGVALCILDNSKPEDDAHSVPVTMSGEIAGVLSGLGSCVYLTLAEGLRHKIEPPVFYFSVIFQYAFFCTIASFFLDDTPPEFSFDPVRGYFGWMVPGIPGRLLAQLWLAFIVDWAGNFGFIAAMKYVPSIVVASFMLLGPFVATVEGIIIGVETVPGVWTILGSCVIVVGSAIISLKEQQQTTSVMI